MQRKLGFLAGILLMMSYGAVAPPAAAQNVAGVSGLVTDVKGTPMPDMVVILKSKDQGTEYTLKTDKTGMYKQLGLRPGPYAITLKAKDAAQPLVEGLACTVAGNTDNRCDIDLKKLVAAQPELEAARKKQEEDIKKFDSMKSAYNAGQAKTDEADKARAEMSDTYAIEIRHWQEAVALRPAKNPEPQNAATTCCVRAVGSGHPNTSQRATFSFATHVCS